MHMDYIDHFKHTCHCVRDDCDKEPLISHLYAHVRVLHGHNHFLHLSGERAHGEENTHITRTHQ